MVEHPLEHLGGVALPVVDLADDAQRVAGAVGPRGVAGESLVGDVGVVLERAQGFDDVDVATLVAAGERGRQLAPQTAVSTSAEK